jgi:hypothetical protein
VTSGVKRGYVDTLSGQVHYRCSGATGQPVVAFLHQTASSGRMFERVMVELGGDFNCCAFGTPGRMHLTRFHGVFAPHSRLRAAVTPAHRGVGSEAESADPDRPATPRHVAMTWARRLKRVFGIEINTCTRCGGQLKVIASIEEPEVGNSLAPPRQTAPGQGV